MIPEGLPAGIRSRILPAFPGLPTQPDTPYEFLGLQIRIDFDLEHF
jgi:hypothetical protein